MTTQFKRQTMYYKVRELFEKKYKVSQISRETGKDPKTIRKYLRMSPEDFDQLLLKLQHRHKKLKPFELFIKERLEGCPDCSAAQVDDWLKETYPDILQVASKTVFNFVSYVRKRYNIPKVQGHLRQYQQVEQLPYGQQTQVDFGQYVMQKPDGGRQRVYFITMVLARSRQKYVRFTLNPIVTRFGAESMDLGFDFFEGITEEVVFDQDCTLLKDENHGDLLLTEEFNRYVQQRRFKLHFCRKADPESKGKIENVVKYVKQNFLRGRLFTSIETLNEQSLSWLSRTANAKEHASIRRIPCQEWLIEKAFLAPFTGFIPLTESQYFYHVRKDNVISFKGNQYTVPLGTYRDCETLVQVKVKEGSLEIFDQDLRLLARHPMARGKGRTIRNAQHLRDTSQKVQHLIEEISALFTNPSLATLFLEHIRKEKPRYVRDQLTLIRKETQASDPSLVLKALEYCLKNRLYSATEFCDVLHSYHHRDETLPVDLTKVNILLPLGDASFLMQYEPSHSDINDYQTIIQ
jgi:transposase